MRCEQRHPVRSRQYHDQFQSKQAMENPQDLFPILGEGDPKLKEKFTLEFIKAEYSFALNYMMEARSLVEDPGPHVAAKLEELSDRIENNKLQYPITAMIAPAYSKVFTKYHEHQSRVRLNLIALKIEEYKTKNGVYPDSLKPLFLPDDILIESITGKPFKYENGILKASYKYKENQNLEIKIQ